MAQPQINSSKAEASSVLTPEMAAMMKLIIEEMRKPAIDHDLEAKKEAARQRMRAQREESLAQTAAIQDSCSHLRDDNTSRVAWQTLYWQDKKIYVRDGFCQLCNKHYHPGVPGYEHMLRVPVGKAGVIG